MHHEFFVPNSSSLAAVWSGDVSWQR